MPPPPSLCHLPKVDWIIADMLAIRQDALGHVRYVLKDGLKWLPLYGCYFSKVRETPRCRVMP